MIGAFIAIGILIVFATVVGLVLLFFLHHNKQLFSFKLLFGAYFYLVAMISLLAVVFGGTLVTKAVLSSGFGRDFSYYNYAMVHPEPPVLEDSGGKSNPDTLQQKEVQARAVVQEQDRIEAEYQNDLFNGISALIVGLLFLIVHVFGWSRLDPASGRKESLLYKGYVLLQLVVYSLITLVALPMAISGTLRHFLVRATDTVTSAPGESVAVALWVTPVWLFWVWLTMRTLRKS